MSADAILLLLAATLPLAGAGWAAAILAERLQVDAKTRGRLWLAALIVPLALVPAILVAQALRPAPDQTYAGPRSSRPPRPWPKRPSPPPWLRRAPPPRRSIGAGPAPPSPSPC